MDRRRHAIEVVSGDESKSSFATREAYTREAEQQFEEWLRRKRELRARRRHTIVGGDIPTAGAE